jgi:hypothetical protein
VDPVSAFEAAARRMLAADDAVEHGRMFHNDGLKVDGRFLGFATKDDVVVKLPAHRVRELIACGEGRPCQIGKRTMREWVRLRPADEGTCVAYLSEAREFAASR